MTGTRRRALATVGVAFASPLLAPAAQAAAALATPAVSVVQRSGATLVGVPTVSGAGLVVTLDGHVVKRTTSGGTTYLLSAAASGRRHSLAVRAANASVAASVTMTLAPATVARTGSPGVTPTALPPGRTTSGKAQFAFRRATGVAATCSLDGAAARTCKGTFAATGLTVGTHTVAIRTRRGARSLGRLLVTWRVLPPAPSITVLTEPSGDMVRRSAATTFTITGAVTSSTCGLDATRAHACSTHWESSPVAPGRHVLTLRATGPGGTTVRTIRWRTLRQRILWGAWVDGSVYPGLLDPPWDMRALDRFESSAQKRTSILFFGWPWKQKGTYNIFRPALMDAVRSRGTIPMLDWLSWDTAAGGSRNQPTFQLGDIIAGRHDAYIRAFARASAAWGHPYFIRFDHEMNGTWYPWSERSNGNRAGQFVKAWRHVRAIFAAEHASNVTWVWAPNIEYPGGQAYAGLYPGDRYVDWVALDGYNWATNPVHPDIWRTFSMAFLGSYNRLGKVAPKKPVMIAEVATNEKGGSKAKWITDALSHQLIDVFPRIRALIWFNWGRTPGLQWPIESSRASRTAFRAAIRSPYFAANEFSTIDGGPVQPLPATVP